MWCAHTIRRHMYMWLCITVVAFILTFKRSEEIMMEEEAGAEAAPFQESEKARNEEWRTIN